MELLYKLWKQHGQVDEWRTSNPWRVLCELYAKLIGVLLQHWLLVRFAWQDAQRSFLRPAIPDMTGPLLDLCHALERECRAGLADAAPCDLPVTTRFAADMRYIGQSYEMEVPLPLDAADPIAGVLASFTPATATCTDTAASAKQSSS